MYATKALKNVPVNVTLIDKRNFHLFQPLLYQVATGGLSPGDITSPLRAVFKRRKRVRVVMDEVVDIDPSRKKVLTREGRYSYDTLVLATGVTSSYFGHDDWRDKAYDLKTIEDALEMRERVLTAFEAAEITNDDAERKACLTFVIVGGGPTGVELAGALAELCQQTLKNEFRAINTGTARIFLIEASERLLQSFPSFLSRKAAEVLGKRGVTVLGNSIVSVIDKSGVLIKTKNREEKLETRTVLWAAGIEVTPLGKMLAEKIGVKTDRLGRLTVRADLSLEGEPDIFVIGDLALAKDKNGEPLPGVAPVAMQQGKYVA
ncbi:MAG: NAD(P)/FAD-dependent oxidoreductase, partial [candidate division Zixibacteria bacterium]|nr:NAD(P)/FAD-dependent oxidoreductase [candidate division Zixibacteria bacterium]